MRFTKSLAMLGLLALAGCSTNQAERTRISPVTLDIQDAPAVRVLGAHIHPLNSHAVVHGRLRQQAWGGALAGHVDVEVRTPDGQVLERFDIPLERATYPRTRSRDAVFSGELPGPVPAGSTVRVRYHAGRHT